MGKSYDKRFESYQKSLTSLKEGKIADKSNQLILSGIIMIFNLTFDLSWKLLREIMKEDHGVVDFPSGSPKETLKKAKGLGLIDDDIWLDMLNDRNELVHDYDFELAEEKVNKIIDDYLPAFEKLENKYKS